MTEDPWVQDWIARKVQAQEDPQNGDAVKRALQILASQLPGQAITGPGGPGDNEGPGTGPGGGAPPGSGGGNPLDPPPGSGGGGGGEQLPPELAELMELLMGRMRYQEPLFQAITQQAMGGLPRPYNGRPPLGPAGKPASQLANNTQYPYPGQFWQGGPLT
jgi:hypothetical protein